MEYPDRYEIKVINKTGQEKVLMTGVTRVEDWREGKHYYPGATVTISFKLKEIL